MLSPGWSGSPVGFACGRRKHSREDIKATENKGPRRICVVPTMQSSHVSLPCLRCPNRAHLILDGWLIQVVTADGAGVSANSPAPHGHGVPLLDLKLLLRCRGGSAQLSERDLQDLAIGVQQPAGLPLLEAPGLCCLLPPRPRAHPRPPPSAHRRSSCSKNDEVASRDVQNSPALIIQRS